jgi:hypothetical protein
MSAKVTYLFGAGASHGVLPVVKEFNDAFAAFSQTMHKEFSVLQAPVTHDLSAFANEVANHSSIDTYARILFLKGDFDKLRRLKFFLSLFFYVEQRNKPVNKRYDLFLASIIGGYSGSPKLPKNIRILSWNYDSQFELSALKFFSAQDTHEVRAKLPLSPKFDASRLRASFYNGFMLHKINGSADLLVHVDGQVVRGLSLPALSDSTKISNLPAFKDYLKYHKGQGHRSMLCYSWESEDIIDCCREECGAACVRDGSGHPFAFWSKRWERTARPRFF